MTRTNAPLASDLGLSLAISALATVLLLILSTTSVSAQTRMTWPRATRALQRGEVLRADDYVLADTTIVWHWKEPSVDTMTAVAGWVTRRPIAEGEFMHTPSIAPANAINMGSTVKVIYQDGPVRLTLTGTATNNAALGAPVGVRLDKNRRLDGIAVGPNTVRLR